MSHASEAAIALLLRELRNLTIDESLKKLAKDYSGSVTFSTSFSLEDQVITHLIAQSGADISLFTLDTGRLFEQTYAVWENTNAHFDIKVKGYYPDNIQVEKFLDEKGPNAFYSSVDNRKECCYIRKVIPLKRALNGKQIWVTGLRAEHSVSREGLELLEWDEGNQIIKYNPLLHWSTDEVKAYIARFQIPYNTLHDKGFVSIGCEPCTRAIREGESFRAGRWWWEDNSKKECGLHIKQ